MYFPWTRQADYIGAYVYVLLGLSYKYNIAGNVFLVGRTDKQSGLGRHTIYFLNEWSAAVSAQDAGRGLKLPQYIMQYIQLEV